MLFVYKHKLQWLPSAKDNVYIYICTYIQKTKKLRNVFIYKNSDTFQKSRQFVSRFYIQKVRHFTLRDFSWECWNWHLYTKSMTLFVMWRFIYTKIQTLKKIRQFALCLYAKIQTLCVSQFFIEFLKLADGGGGGYMQKTNHFVLHFYMQKKALRYVLDTKSRTLCR